MSEQSNVYRFTYDKDQTILEDMVNRHIHDNRIKGLAYDLDDNNKVIGFVILTKRMTLSSVKRLMNIEDMTRVKGRLDRDPEFLRKKRFDEWVELGQIELRDIEILLCAVALSFFSFFLFSIRYDLIFFSHSLRYVCRCRPSTCFLY